MDWGVWSGMAAVIMVHADGVSLVVQSQLKSGPPAFSFICFYTHITDDSINYSDIFAHLVSYVFSHIFKILSKIFAFC